MEFISTQKYLVTSPRKLREIAYMIKKLSPSDALNRMPFSVKRAANPLSKVIKSALANAKQKGIEAEELVFESIQINEGPRLRRWKAGSRGRAKPYKKRMSHIKVILTVKQTPKVVVEKKSEETKTKEEVKAQSSKVKTTVKK